MHHFFDLLEQLKTRVARMTALVQQSVEGSIEAVLKSDAELARRVIAMDEKIDAEEVGIEQDAIALLALYQPAAGDLRLLTTIIKVNSDFERIADCAVNIAQRVLLLAHQKDFHPEADLRLMANSVIATLRDTIKAFNLSEANLARRVISSDDVIDALYGQIVQEMLAQIEADSHKAGEDLAAIMVAKNLERIADHCINIAEDVIYIHTGRIVRHVHTA
jgi:phosphate transport system protein